MNITKKLSLLFLSIFVFFLGCSTNKADDQHIVIHPFKGLVQEPIFNNDVYLNMQGNPAGEVVVLIHGLGDNASKIWDQTIDELKHQYFLVTLDLPGFGKSAKTNQLYSPGNYSLLINHLTQKYIQKPFHLVGHSMGGAISLNYAATYPDDVKTLTLVDAAGILHRLAYTKYLAPLGLKSFSKALTFKNDQVTSLAGRILSQLENYMNVDLNVVIKSEVLRASVLQGNPHLISAMALVLEDFSLIPQQITAPTQIIWGKRDAVAPVRTGYVLNALIPDSSLHIIDEAGHVPITQNADEFYQLLRQGFENMQSPSNKEIHNDNAKKSAFCENQNDIEFSGHIETLTINNCKNVLVKNAYLNQIQISNSSVYFENVDISTSQTALIVDRSNVEITAGKIQGKVAIDAVQSHLDIAGTRIIAQDNIITASTTPTNFVVFSLTPASNSIGQQTVLHGQFNLSLENDFFKP